MTPSEIAKGLSKAQREALRNACYGPGGWRTERRNDSLCRLGLCVVGTSKLTDAGLAVRAIIEQESRGE